MRSLISKHVAENIDQIFSEFNTARPFRHVVIDGFLKEDVANAMLLQFPNVDDLNTLKNEFGDPSAKASRPDVTSLGPIYEDVDRYIQTDEFLDLMTGITGIGDLKYDPYYFGAGTHNNFHSSGLDPHYDFNIHPNTAQHRRLNAIIYLNKDWNPEWKGQISFHSNPWDVRNDHVKHVDPVFNRCVIFETTESSWHSVPIIELPEDMRHLSRKSFTIYLYTDTRPAEETAVPHETVYVQPNLPDHIREGHTLTKEDMDLIYKNLEKRSYYLKNLYKREYKFSALVERLKADNDRWRKKSHVPILGAARLIETESPPYPDGWLGRDTKVSIELTSSIRSVATHLWIPELFGDGVGFTFTVGDAVTQELLAPGSHTLELPINGDQGERIELSLKADRTGKVSHDDERFLTGILQNIELKD